MHDNCQFDGTLIPGNVQIIHCLEQRRLLRTRARSRDANDHLCAARQLDVLFCAEQDAGSLSHSGILLPGALFASSTPEPM